MIGFWFSISLQVVVIGKITCGYTCVYYCPPVKVHVSTECLWNVNDAKIVLNRFPLVTIFLHSPCIYPNTLNRFSFRPKTRSQSHHSGSKLVKTVKLMHIYENWLLKCVFFTINHTGGFSSVLLDTTPGELLKKPRACMKLLY